MSKLLDMLVPVKLFARLNIASKILVAYMLLVALTVVVVVYALISLQRINSLNTSIVKVDVIAEEASGKMLDALLAQDTYEKRYLILKSDDMQTLFAKRGEEFVRSLAALKELPAVPDVPLAGIESLYEQYSRIFIDETRLVRAKQIKKADALSNTDLRRVLESLIEKLKLLNAASRAAQDRKMVRISEIGNTAFATTAFLCVFSIILGAGAGLVVTHHISSSLQKLKIATEHISEGNFDFDPQIETQDEIGNLSQAFIAMGKRLRKLEEMYLDASPLTRLPGGIAIENVLKKRLESNQPIALCVLDLDNFKAFNDRYGYANGSEVLKETARIIENGVKMKGSPEDFIGHVGGDDFVVITTPPFMREVATEIINRFDRKIPDFYDPIDRERGHILGKTRQGVEMQFPIMTISIAIVTNERRNLTNHLEASEIAAELKDYAKTIPRSVFVIDKRRTA